ncbi:MAG TPA: ATP-dependent Clp protease adaptor ClpS [Bacteroidales bacterium]|nr:ATP-dependent Clp protease adaptor ClpS [Bacteroidales bacterium]HOK74712.1 ATP-dependent Clp protease adaptor ClpS [Bacteroidales bacterium]HOM40415.1 ATP-dependent Clp protease adaptor ClpS [Bacteroidales bacterium]HOU29821.1 ATP-dependent Clp protease adaptor ClpS [Bacteroidales bacterium]HPP93136.1 ATP-dependent Clp protease adaptor ClpS [Bacteroidales bacterium]
MAKGEPLRKKFKGDASEKCTLILYNDDVNTFSHVIKSLVEVCGHDEIQAEQCAVLVHFKGKLEVKSGSPEMIMAMSEKLNKLGLKSKVLKIPVR